MTQPVRYHINSYNDWLSHVRDIRELLGGVQVLWHASLLKLNLHWRGPRWSAGSLRYKAIACHSTVCQMHTTYAQSIFHLSGAGECRLSFMEAMAKTDTRTERRKHTHTHTHTHTHKHTHLGGRSSTCWVHLGGFHNERGTVAKHTQVTTLRKQMRLHVGSPLVWVKWATRRRLKVRWL